MIIDLQVSDDEPKAAIQSITPKLSRSEAKPSIAYKELSPSPEKTESQSPDMPLVAEQLQPSSALEIDRIKTDGAKSDLDSPYCAKVRISLSKYG